MRANDGEIPNIFLKQSEICIATGPAIVTTVLGSCLSVILFHRALKLGGICHALLPTCPERTGCRKTCPGRFKYVDCAIEWMFKSFSTHRACGPGLEVKLFGGGSMIETERGIEYAGVGKQNYLAAERELEARGFKPVSKDVGGSVGRKLIFFAHTGEVYVKRINGRLPIKNGQYRGSIRGI